MTKHRITAFSKAANRRVLIFTWTREPEAGVRKAQEQAKELGLENEFSDFRAEKVH